MTLDILQAPQDTVISFSQEIWAAVLWGVVKVGPNKDVCQGRKSANLTFGVSEKTALGIQRLREPSTDLNGWTYCVFTLKVKLKLWLVFQLSKFETSWVLNIV